MTTQVLICDDSGFARKQMARSIPEGWAVDVSFAEHGRDALNKIKEQHFNQPMRTFFQLIHFLHHQIAS